MRIVAPPRATIGQAQTWARTNNAHARFVNDIVPALFAACDRQRQVNGRAVDPAVAVAQSAKETGWGKFGGVIDETFHNTAGIKTAQGGPNDAPDAHERFPTWAEGARAHLNHLGAYTGLDPVGEPHGRWHVVKSLSWAGTIVTVAELGARWAPNPDYGRDIERMTSQMTGGGMIVGYADWCDVTPNGVPSRISTPTPRLWLHHGASGKSDVATARAYARYHIRTLGWLHVGYSFLIAEGKVLEGRGAGRSGGHTRGDNTSSHGIVMCGSYGSKAPADRDLDALVALIRHGHDRGWWPATLTGGHRDAPGASTACPGTALHRLIGGINTRATFQEDDTVLLTRIDNSDQVWQVVGHALVALTSPKQAEAIAKLAGWPGRWQDHVGNLSASEASAFREIPDLRADQIAADARYAAKGHGHTVRLE